MLFYKESKPDTRVEKIFLRRHLPERNICQESGYTPYSRWRFNIDSRVSEPHRSFSIRVKNRPNRYIRSNHDKTIELHKRSRNRAVFILSFIRGRVLRHEVCSSDRIDLLRGWRILDGAATVRSEAELKEAAVPRRRR